MAAPVARSANPEIREVARGLAAAQDRQIMRAVAMVDAMPNRGAADQLIAPLRGRLTRLRPPRPLRFARLLFLPLDPLIVPAAHWRAEQATIPRTVIPLLAATVATALGPIGRTVASMIEGHTTHDDAVVDAAGGLLWKNAAQLLLDAPLPPGWESTGLYAQVHKPLTRRIGVLLLQAERMREMTADAAQGLVPPEANSIQTILADAIQYDPDVQPMVIALLLARVPDAAPVLARVATALGQRGGALLRLAGEQAADMLLDRLEAPGGADGQLGGQDLAQAGATVRRLTSLLGALDDESASPDRRSRLNDLRARIKSGCEAFFTERLASDLLEPLRACVPDAGTPAGWRLEIAARGLRALETEARRAGDTKTYDTLLAQTADIVREVTAQGGLGQVEGLRLVEIVAGADAALAMLGEET